jgi:hypothetical protein
MSGFRAGNTAGIGLSPDWPLGLYMNDRDPPATVFKKWRKRIDAFLLLVSAGLK